MHSKGEPPMNFCWWINKYLTLTGDSQFIRMDGCISWDFQGIWLCSKTVGSELQNDDDEPSKKNTKHRAKNPPKTDGGRTPKSLVYNLCKKWIGVYIAEFWLPILKSTDKLADLKKNKCSYKTREYLKCSAMKSAYGLLTNTRVLTYVRSRQNGGISSPDKRKAGIVCFCRKDNIQNRPLLIPTDPSAVIELPT